MMMKDTFLEWSSSIERRALERSAASELRLRSSINIYEHSHNQREDELVSEQYRATCVCM